MTGTLLGSLLRKLSKDTNCTFYSKLSQFQARHLFFFSQNSGQFPILSYRISATGTGVDGTHFFFATGESVSVDWRLEEGLPTDRLWTVPAVVSDDAMNIVNCSKFSCDFFGTPRCSQWRRYRSHAFTFAMSTQWKNTFTYHLFVLIDVLYSDISMSARSTPPIDLLYLLFYNGWTVDFDVLTILHRLTLPTNIKVRYQL